MDTLTRELADAVNNLWRSEVKCILDDLKAQVIVILDGDPMKEFEKRICEVIDEKKELYEKQ